MGVLSSSLENNEHGLGQWTHKHENGLRFFALRSCVHLTSFSYLMYCMPFVATYNEASVPTIMPNERQKFDRAHIISGKSLIFSAFLFFLFLFCFTSQNWCALLRFFNLQTLFHFNRWCVASSYCVFLASRQNKITFFFFNKNFEFLTAIFILYSSQILASIIHEKLLPLQPLFQI